MSTSLQRSVPTLLAAIAGFAVAAGAVRLEQVLRKERRDPARAPPDTVQASDEPLRLQQQRALEPGRGRHAETPTRMPWQGWKDIFWRTVAEISADRLMLIAGGVVFYGLLALVPALTALVSVYGIFTTPRSLATQLNFLADFIPAGAYQLISDQVVRIASGNDGKLTVAALVGLGLALWSANAGMKAIFDALNIVYEEDEKRSFVRLNAISLAFTFCAILMLVLMIGAVVVVPLILSFMGFATEHQAALLAMLRWPVLYVLVMLALAVLYRFGPSRDRAQWRWVSVGSLFATTAWLAISLAFSWYLSRFADYNATYGSLGAVIGLIMWMWLSVSVILVGAELNSEVEHQTARDTTTGQPKPMGARGAVMADTVGAAQG